MQNFDNYNNLAAMGAEQDPDDPKSYIEAYQEGLFKKTNKVAIKGGYIVEALEREPDGRIKEVKITKDGVTELYNLAETKAKFSQEIEKKIEKNYNIKSNKNYYITVSGIKKGKIIEKKLKYNVITNELLKDFLDSEFITIKSSYRVINLSSVLGRLSNMSSVTGVLKEFGRVMEDIETNCGILGTECLNLKDSFNIFMVINSIMFKNNFYPIGNYILVDDMIIQQYGKQIEPDSIKEASFNSFKTTREPSTQTNVNLNNQAALTEGIKNKSKGSNKKSKSLKKKKPSKKRKNKSESKKK